MGKNKADQKKEAANRQSEEGAREPDVNAPELMRKKEYRAALATVQIDVFRLQEWVHANGLRVVILLEGLGPAGRRGTANRIAEGLDRRVVDVVTLEPPSKRERGQWYFQRFVERFPRAGCITIFEGSWYHGPATERALGLVSEEDFADFLRSCADFERTLCDSGVMLIKYWFSAADLEQERRFRARIEDLQKHKKLQLPDRKAGASPVLVAEVRDAVFASTGNAFPWYVVEANEKRRGRLNAIAHLLSLVPRNDYQSETAPADPEQASEVPAPAGGYQPVQKIY